MLTLLKKVISIVLFNAYLKKYIVMSAEQITNSKLSSSDNRHRSSKKEKTTKNINAEGSLHKPNPRGHEEKLSKTDQPIGEFSDWNKPRS